MLGRVMIRGLHPRLAAVGAVLAAAGCSGVPNTSAVATPAPTRSAATPPAEAALPDFNSRLGSNRLAAEAGALVGRRLFRKGQYWEVFIRTQPVSLPGRYDPGNPAASAPQAAQVTAAEVVLATESGAAIKAFSEGGEEHERQVLAEVDADVRQAFPNIRTDTIRVFYGEAFQHSTAIFERGRLIQYDVRKLT
jgi:hypothetical protein